MPTEVTVTPTQMAVGKGKHPQLDIDIISIHFIDDETHVVYTMVLPEDGADELVRIVQTAKSGIEIPPKAQLLVPGR